MAFQPFRVVTGALLAIAVTGAAPLAQPRIDPLAVRLQASLDAMESLEGRFVQSLDSRSLGRPRFEKGSFAIRKPAMMRWSYEEPERKIAITDGHETWLYLPEDREAHRGTLDESGAGVAVLLLAGKVRLDRDFNSRALIGAELDAAGPQGVAGALVLELTPVKPEEEFEKLIVAAEPDRMLIRRVTVVDSLGGRMIFDLFELKENSLLSDDLFRFEAPPGVEIIDER